MRQEDQQHYRNINDLYALYAQANDSDRETILLIIQEEALKLKYRKYGTEIGYGDYSDKVVNKVATCMKSFPISKACGKRVPFSKYLCNAINNMIGSILKKQALEDKNGGISMTEYQQRMNSKLKDILKGINPDLNGESFIEEVTKKLRVKKRSTTIRHLQNMTATTIDIENAAVTGKAAQPEKELVSRETMMEKLRKIDAAWKKKHNKMLSELLTVCMLDIFDMEKNDLDYDFIDRTILDDYFDLQTYRFPEEQEIAEKHGFTKSAAAQKLTRFGKKIGIEFHYPRQSKDS